VTGLDVALLDRLTAAAPRLPELARWLIDEVWNAQSFDRASGSPKHYLLSGEKLVNDRESLLGATARGIYEELAAHHGSTIAGFFDTHPRSAAVVFDGCSLRELPRLIALARASRRAVLKASYSRSAVPSETIQFVAHRLGFGLSELGPSQLASRRELKERDVRYFYFGQAASYHTIDDCAENLLLWCRFPDQRYTDSTAVNEGLFDGVWDGFQLAWQNTVQALPADRTVLVTSDHGYVFLKSGFSDTRLKNVDRPLDGKRFRFFGRDGHLPERSPGLWVDETRRLAVLTGRAHNRPLANSAWHSVYRHGGLSLMEVLTPWLVLGPMGSA
jgi:hypothetical protein